MSDLENDNLPDNVVYFSKYKAMREERDLKASARPFLAASNYPDPKIQAAMEKYGSFRGKSSKGKENGNV